jgi:hypothetical protein
MKRNYLIAAVFSGVVLMAPFQATALTFNFTATRTDVTPGITAGSAVAFASTAAAATVSGSFSYDPDASLVATLPNVQSALYLFSGPGSITLNGSGGATYTGSEPTVVPGVGAFSVFVQDADVGAPDLADIFGITGDNSTDGFSVTFRRLTNDWITPGQIPRSFLLDEAAMATGTFNIFSRVVGDDGAAAFRLTSVTQVPMPASVWLMLAGLLGVGTSAWRRQTT